MSKAYDDYCTPHDAFRVIHEASLFLEMSFRRTQAAIQLAQNALRTAQCELPLNEKQGEKLKTSEVVLKDQDAFVSNGLNRIYLIQSVCEKMRLDVKPPGNGHNK